MLFAILAKSCYDLSKPENSESGDSWLGIGPPLSSAIASMLLGVVLMLWWKSAGHREFFRRRQSSTPAELATSTATGPEG